MLMCWLSECNIPCRGGVNKFLQNVTNTSEQITICKTNDIVNHRYIITITGIGNRSISCDLFYRIYMGISKTICVSGLRLFLLPVS